MNELRCTQIININPGLSPYPQFIIRIWQQITTKNRFTTLIDSQQVTHLPRSQIQLTHTFLHRTNIQTIIVSLNYFGDYSSFKFSFTIFWRSIRMHSCQIIFGVIKTITIKSEPKSSTAIESKTFDIGRNLT